MREESRYELCCFGLIVVRGGVFFPPGNGGGRVSAASTEVGGS